MRGGVRTPGNAVLCAAAAIIWQQHIYIYISARTCAESAYTALLIEVNGTTTTTTLSGIPLGGLYILVLLDRCASESGVTRYIEGKRVEIRVYGAVDWTIFECRVMTRRSFCDCAYVVWFCLLYI